MSSEADVRSDKAAWETFTSTVAKLAREAGLDGVGIGGFRVNADEGTTFIYTAVMCGTNLTFGQCSQGIAAIADRLRLADPAVQRPVAQA